MRKFIKQELIAVVCVPMSHNEDEVFGHHSRRVEKTLCTSNPHARAIINGYVLKHDPFQLNVHVPLNQVMDRL